MNCYFLFQFPVSDPKSAKNACGIICKYSKLLIGRSSNDSHAFPSRSGATDGAFGEGLQFRVPTEEQRRVGQH